MRKAKIETAFFQVQFVDNSKKLKSYLENQLISSEIKTNNLIKKINKNNDETEKPKTNTKSLKKGVQNRHITNNGSLGRTRNFFKNQLRSLVPPKYTGFYKQSLKISVFLKITSHIFEFCLKGVVSL